MKNNMLIILLFGCTIVSQSFLCGTHDVQSNPPAGATPASTPNVDAATAAQTITYPGSNPFPQSVDVTSGLDAVIASVFAWFTSSPLKSPAGHDTLPSTYRYSGNQYEYVGDLHNKMCTVALGRPSIDSTTKLLLNYDSAECFRYLNAVSHQLSNLGLTSSGVYHFWIDSSVGLHFNDTTSYIALTDMQKIEHIGLPTTQTNYLKNVFNHYADMLEDKASFYEIASYLNNKIKAIYDGAGETLTQNEKAEVIYITVLKHSHFYWYGS